MSHLPPASSSTSTSQTDMAMAASSSATTSHSPFNQFGDTTLTKVFVGGLAWETQRDTMRRYFEQFGEILEAVVITDKTTGRSKGYGFVTFRDPEGARRACADPTPVIDGRRANCNLASLGVRSRPGTPQHGGRFRASSPYAGGSSSGLQVYSGAAATTFSQPLPYAYHQSFPYPPYGYPMYHPEYPYPTNMYNAQNMYSPYATTQFPAVYGGPSSATGVYPYPFSQAPQITTGFSPQQQQQQQQSGYGLQAAPQLVPYASPGVSTITSLSPFGGTAVPLQIQSTGFSPDLLSPSGLSGNAPQFAMQPSPTQQPQFPPASGGSQQSSS